MEIEIWREVKAEPPDDPDETEYGAGPLEDKAVKREGTPEPGSPDNMTEDDLRGSVHFFLSGHVFRVAMYITITVSVSVTNHHCHLQARFF